MDSSFDVTVQTAPPPEPEEPIESLKVYLTAEEAFPAFEQAFLDAEREISGSFRVFDLNTRLRSPQARKIGETWFDLLSHTLERGVAVRLVVSDFDPVAAPDLHQLAWSTQRQVADLRDRVKRDVKLEFTVALHDACAGAVPRLFFYPMVRHKMNKVAQMWLAMSQREREQFRSETPRLQKLCYENNNGKLCFPLRLVDLHPATHHQKMAVFDRKTVYVGGLDLNERRYDTKQHRRPAPRTWHDVQAIVTGPVAEAAQKHLDGFLDTVAGTAPPAEPARGFLRTLSRARRRAPMRIAPKTAVREVERAHYMAIRRSRQLIYLETQFLRHFPLARALARRARECPDLRLIVVLPAAPEDVAFSSSRGLDARFGEYQQVRSLSRLRAGFGSDRMVVASPVQPRERDSDGRDTLEEAPLIYVHSKVSVFDGFGATVTSANLNGRSLRWDTEAGIYLNRPEHVAELRRRVMGHWLPKDAGDAFFDPATAFDHWRRLVEFNSASPPEKRRGFLVRYDSDAAREVATPAPGMPEEIV